MLLQSVGCANAAGASTAATHPARSVIPTRRFSILISITSGFRTSPPRHRVRQRPRKNLSESRQANTTTSDADRQGQIVEMERPEAKQASRERPLQ